MHQFILLILLAYSGSIWAQGSTVGKGGDTIKCDPSSLNDFQGHYTLDYLLEYNSGVYQTAENINFEILKTKLSKYFGTTHPELAQSLENYSQSLYKKDAALGRVWTKVETQLFDIKDEEIIKQIPENCLDLEAGKYVLKLQQTVIRQSFKDYIEYNYDEAILLNLKNHGPLQYSFFLVHEWLWDFTRNIEAVRKLNWVLHSSKLELISPEDFRIFLEKIKFGVLDLPICERGPSIRAAFNKSCQNVSKQDLLTVNELSLNIKQNILRPGDLYGFSRLKKLSLSGAKFLPARAFNSLFQLETLDLSGTQINFMSELVLTDLKYLNTLTLPASMSDMEMKKIKAYLKDTMVKR